MPRRSGYAGQRKRSTNGGWIHITGHLIANEPRYFEQGHRPPQSKPIDSSHIANDKVIYSIARAFSNSLKALGEDTPYE